MYKKVSTNGKNKFWILSLTIVMLMLTTMLIPTLPATSTDQTRADTGVIPEWYSDVIYKGSKAIDGCAIGDCYPDHTGNEVVFCSREYDLWMAYRDGTKWTNTRLWQGLGQPLTPAIGDFDPDHEGNEILLVGMHSGLEDDGGEGDALEIYYDQTTKQWKSEVIFENPKMLHGATIGDIDPRTEGNELVVVGFAYNVTLLKKVSGNWISELMWHDNNNVRKAVIDDFDAAHEGNELVVVSKSGKVAMVYWDGSAWKTTVLWTDPDGLARCAVGDCDPDHDGKEVVVGSDSGKVYLVRGSGSTWESKLVFTDTDKNRGVWVGDVDPFHEGNEIIAYGYSAKVTEITGSGDNWDTTTVWTDSARGHEVRIGEFDPNHEGNEILAVGYSNNATMVANSLWFSDVVFKGTKAIDGCAIGDCYPEHEGNEAVFCSREYDLWMAYRDGTKWTNTRLWQGLGQPLTPAIGDFDPDHEGNEILLVGMHSGLEDDGGEGDALEIYYDQTTKQWKSEVIFENLKMLHGAAIGDIDPRTEGNELVVVGFAYNVTLLKKVSGNWVSELMWHDNNNVRKAVIDDFDAAHEGNELVVVSKSGKVAMIYWDGSAWKTTVLWTDPDGLARCAVGDCDPDHDGKEVVVGSDSGKVYLVRGSGSTWESKLVFTDTDKNRGVWVGDVDPFHEGNEIIAYGYSAKVTEIIGNGDNWKTKTLWTDSARGHEIRIGEFDDTHSGNEILVVGYSNNATLIGYHGIEIDADFKISSLKTTQMVTAGDEIDFTIDVDSVGGFNSPVSFKITGALSTVSYSLFPNTLIPDSSTKLTFKVPATELTGDHKVTVSASGGGKTHEIKLDLKIVGDTTPPNLNTNFPVDNDKDVNVNSNITITFSKDMNKSSVESGFSISPNVTGTFIWDGNLKLIFTPTSDLEEGQTYKITISKDVKDLAGNALGEDKTFSFTTLEEDDGGGDDGYQTIIVIIIVIVVIFIIIAVLMRKKHK